jgi:dUTP pyrophosphatase
VMVLVVNLGREAFAIRRGERIAQLVVQRVERARLVEAAEIAATRRGPGGFGSTGTKGRAKKAGVRRASEKSRASKRAR